MDAGADQLVELAAGRAVAHQPVGVDVHGTGAEDHGEGLGGVGLDGLAGDLDGTVADLPRGTHGPLPQRGVLVPGRPARRMERPDEVVPGPHRVELARQRLESGPVVQRGAELGEGEVSLTTRMRRCSERGPNW